jgi:NAD(P)H-dependent flavin oxidoreductase YrpB (nitropropane dioxygenase family)
MKRRTRVTERLGIDIPLIQAPMGGGRTTSELVAAVSRAGGLGSVAAGSGSFSRRCRRSAGRCSLYVDDPKQLAPGFLDTTHGWLRRVGRA